MDAHETIEAMFASMENLDSKVDKAEAGREIIESHGSDSFIEALASWLESGPAEFPEQYFESMGRRVLWVYPNGLTLTIGADINLTIASMSEQLSPSTALPEICNPDNWMFLPHANGWASTQWYDKETLLEIIQAMEELYGKAKLILPWRNRAESTMDQEEEEFVHADPDDESYNEYLGYYRLMNLANSEDIAFFSEWDLLIVDDEDFISPFTHFEKYQRFTEKLAESKLVILDLEEHCSSCSSGVTEEAIKKDPELEGKPLFITWSQNSNFLVRPDGAINIEANCWDADASTLQKVKQLADALEVPCEIGEGALLFASPDWD
jgi:hypothetical protein